VLSMRRFIGMSPLNVLRATRANLLLRPAKVRRTMPLASFAIGLLLALVALGMSPRASHADATTYSSTKRQFKVGILLVDSTAYNFNVAPPALLPGGPENPDPFVFYIADARSDVKPQNWELINPLAPTQVTADVKARWDARDPSEVVARSEDRNLGNWQPVGVPSIASKGAGMPWIADLLGAPANRRPFD